jgi:integrase
MMTPYLVLRGSRFYFRRGVPKPYQPVLGKREIVVGLKTSDRQVALERYLIEDQKCQALFYALDRGERFPLQHGLTVARLSSMFNFRPIQIASIDCVPIEELVDAMVQNLKIVSDWPVITKAQTSALAATVEASLDWGAFFDRFKKLDRDHFSNKHDQRAKNKRYTPKSNAIAIFREFFPAITNVLSVSRRDALAFKDKLIDMVESDRLQADTANKKLIHLRTVYAKVFEADYQGRKNPFEEISIRVHSVGKRKPMTASDIEKIERHFETSDASDELKALNFIAMNTGAHQKELVFLTKSDINLNAPIPYIRIADNEFRDRVKSGGARHRDIPLVGKGLEWCKKFPEGFPTYCKSGGADNLSAASNKHLKPLTGKTYYGYRHRIADLLRNSGCNDSLKDAILGHTTPGIGSHYGEGYTLEKKRDALLVALNEREKGNVR